MLRLSPRATTESERRSTKGTVYPPLMVRSEEHAVATKEAHIRLKFIKPRFAAKCFVP